MLLIFTKRITHHRELMWLLPANLEIQIISILMNDLRDVIPDCTEVGILTSVSGQRRVGKFARRGRLKRKTVPAREDYSPGPGLFH